MIEEDPGFEFELNFLFDTALGVISEFFGTATPLSVLFIGDFLDLELDWVDVAKDLSSRQICSVGR
jgi:hypothetical protein